MERFKKAAQEYHTELFQRAELFKEGSWLAHSDPELIKIVNKYFANKKNVRVLDLGCGVGRNAIPIAQIIQPQGGRVVCVDLLDIALEKLKSYASQHGVLDALDIERSDAESYVVEENSFDLTIAQSVLEQSLKGEEAFVAAIERLKQGTKAGGINYFGITTGLQELNAQTLEPLPEDIGFKITFEEGQALLRELYASWEVIYEDRAPYEEKYIKNGRMITWRVDFLMFAAQKST